jgi:heme/copper-type cytochrome/quinol oxidase subunit 1
LAPEAQLVPLPSPEPAGFAAYLGTGDHKKIGRLYIGFSLLYLLAALGSSAVLAFEQSDASSFDIFDLDSYFQALSLVGQGIVFLGVVPLLLGFTVSAVTSFAVIAWLLRFLQRRNMLVFVVYRLALALLLFAWF